MSAAYDNLNRLILLNVIDSSFWYFCSTDSATDRAKHYRLFSFVIAEVSLRESHLPVLVVVHGDEYGWNAGNPYNGTMLAAHAQVIVVTLNYRLGAFGEYYFSMIFFECSPNKQANGNRQFQKVLIQVSLAAASPLHAPATLESLIWSRRSKCSAESCRRLVEIRNWSP